MINYNTPLNTDHEFSEEVRNKIPHYSLDNEVSADELEDCDILIKFCILIPIDGLVMMIEVKKVDSEGKLHFNLFGVTEDVDIGNDNVLLSEVSLFEDSIVIVNNIMKLTVKETVSGFNAAEKFHSPEGIHHVCASILNYFFCERFLGAHVDTYLDGDMGLNFI